MDLCLAGREFPNNIHEQSQGLAILWGILLNSPLAFECDGMVGCRVEDLLNISLDIENVREIFEENDLIRMIREMGRGEK